MSAKHGVADRQIAEVEADDRCWLCHRAIGRRVEWHHPKPKSRGGRTTVPVHPICHRAIHATFTNVQLARLSEAGEALDTNLDMQRFLAWVANKPPDFHAPTRKRKA